MTSHSSRADELTAIAAERILVVDGAMGTALQDADLSAADFGGEELDGCNENLVATRPDVVEAVHRSFLEAGADIIETNTFGGTPLVLDEYGLAAQAEDLNRRAAELARGVVEEFERRTPSQPRFVAGSMGPTTKAISVTGGVTFAELLDHFEVQARGLLLGGVDLLLIETQQDTRNTKAAVLGSRRAMEVVGREVPIMVSGTIEPTGTMLAGQTAEAFAASLAHFDLFSVGLNCATGPEFMTDSLRSLSAIARTRTSCIPNAGLPDEDGIYLESPEHIAEVLDRFAAQGWLNVVGGCCGTTPAHTRALRQMVEGHRPRTWTDHHRALYTGIDLVEPDEDNRPLLVGERTNVIGSRKFKRLISAGQYEEASEIARAQAKGGAQILDVCLADPDRDEREDMERFLEQVIRRVKMPLMIDTTDAEVLAHALTYCQGKSIVNSVNLEDGEERFAQIAPLAHRFGAALVVGCIDEDPDQGMAVTRERKLEVARRSYDLLTQKYGMRPEDLIFDPLVFPCATGDEQYRGSAAETIEGVRLIKREFPECKTVLGISNVSFGLPAAGREVLNSVFLYHCTKAGLDLAIVNTERLERFAKIPPEEVRLAEDLLFDRGEDPVAAFAAHFRDAAPRDRAEVRKLPLDERLARYVIDGSKDGLIADLDAKLADTPALEIINGPLMAGMDEVGRLFNANELIVAEVLQSAEVMKAAVSHLEPHMEKSETASRGKVLLATVKGDVHDIGKNLVEIILGNNGYEIVNLGIKVPPETLVQAAREHEVDVIGLSGLLVKSAQQMVVTAEDMRAAGLTQPLLVGGAALSARFTHTRIAPAYEQPTLYARDAMEGLALLQRIEREGAQRVAEEQAAALPQKAATQKPTADAPVPEVRSAAVRTDLPIPEVESCVLKTHEITDLDEVWALINPQMLFGKHLGYRGRVDAGLRDGDEKLAMLVAQVDAVKEEWRREGPTVRLRWMWVPAESEGNQIHLFDAREGGRCVGSWRFPRQRSGDQLCLSDFVLPPAPTGRDHVALMVTGAGEGVVERAQSLKEAGEYLKSHVWQALAVETAEAAAEWLHRRLRAECGFPDPDGLAPLDLFRANYHGKRYSFGYPACPDLEGQSLLFELLRPEEIGVRLTEGFMMEPEASVSALVFHHEDARYFAASDQ